MCEKSENYTEKTQTLNSQIIDISTIVQKNAITENAFA